MAHHWVEKEMKGMTREISETSDKICVPYHLLQDQFLEIIWKKFEEK